MSFANYCHYPAFHSTYFLCRTKPADFAFTGLLYGNKNKPGLKFAKITTIK
jgi:hypothetical protein